MLNTEHPHSAPQEQHIGEGENPNNESQSPSQSPLGDENDYDGTKKPGDEKKSGRRKINIEFIEDKSRRHITFSKRKAGIMKKAYELSTLTGTQVLLLVASETGHVYTFATPKLQPLITKPEGKNLIQSCLNAPEVAPVAPQPQHHQPPRIQSYNEPAIMYPTSELSSREPAIDAVGYDEEKKETKGYPSMGMDMNYATAGGGYPPNLVPSYGMPMVGSSGMSRGGYLPPQYAQASHSQYAQASAVQGQYAPQSQSQYSSGAPYAGMHSLPSTWNKGAGMQSIPMNQMQQGQGSQGQSTSISGLIQASKQQSMYLLSRHRLPQTFSNHFTQMIIQRTTHSAPPSSLPCTLVEDAVQPNLFYY
eukprot:Phypoly_transcript_10715.p1 GENE.Phypoly_transcript_10715~~Phypoly_transcript_10715.p1  ORF type:complete len:362 (+),score=55.95 Phypoly_transcript_10715:113-1198(+)